jgi:predicted O-methyltransferase YrrM
MYAWGEGQGVGHFRLSIGELFQISSPQYQAKPCEPVLPRYAISMHPHSFLDAYSLAPPPTVAAIHADTTAIGFNMASTDATGRMLRTLAAGKPGGRMLELGTGTGLATAWLLDGMDAAATLDTVDINPACVAVARKNLANDSRVRFHIESGSTFLKRPADHRYDLIFADTFPGKFDDLDYALALLAIGGFYVIDDLHPQPNWPSDHAPKIPTLIRALSARPDLALWPIDWDTGIVVAVKRAIP